MGELDDKTKINKIAQVLGLNVDDLEPNGNGLIGKTEKNRKDIGDLRPEKILAKIFWLAAGTSGLWAIFGGLVHRIMGE